MGSKYIKGSKVKDRKEKRERALTDKQLLFVSKYIETNNGAESARYAGYAEASARITAVKLLASDSIRNEIDRRMRILQGSKILSLEEVLSKLSDIALDETAAKSDRVRALELLGKRYAAFTERTESMQDITLDALRGMTSDELRAIIIKPDPVKTEANNQ